MFPLTVSQTLPVLLCVYGDTWNAGCAAEILWDPRVWPFCPSAEEGACAACFCQGWNAEMGAGSWHEDRCADPGCHQIPCAETLPWPVLQHLSVWTGALLLCLPAGRAPMLMDHGNSVGRSQRRVVFQGPVESPSKILFWSAVSHCSLECGRVTLDLTVPG